MPGNIECLPCCLSFSDTGYFAPRCRAVMHTMQRIMSSRSNNSKMIMNHQIRALYGAVKRKFQFTILMKNQTIRSLSKLSHRNLQDITYLQIKSCTTSIKKRIKRPTTSSSTNVWDRRFRFPDITRLISLLWYNDHIVFRSWLQIVNSYTEITWKLSHQVWMSNSFSTFSIERTLQQSSFRSYLPDWWTSKSM